MPEKFEKLAFPVVLDGGLSNLLEARGCDLKQKLWCAEMLRSNPEAIVEAHLAYLRAGADIIKTNSFTATRITQADYQLEDEAAAINAAAAQVARETADEFSTAGQRRDKQCQCDYREHSHLASMSADVAGDYDRMLTYRFAVIMTMTEQE